MEGSPSISDEVLAAYAADAALDAPGVAGLVDSQLHRHRGARVIREEDGGVRVELHLAVDWETVVPDVGVDVQERVVVYLQRMAGVTPVAVDVIVDDVGAPAPAA